MIVVPSGPLQTTTKELATTHQEQQDLEPTCFCQVFHDSWQFFREDCSASHCGLKHRSNSTVSLNHIVVHKHMNNKELYLIMSKYADKFLVVNSLRVKLKIFLKNQIDLSVFF